MFRFISVFLVCLAIADLTQAARKCDIESYCTSARATDADIVDPTVCTVDSPGCTAAKLSGGTKVCTCVEDATTSTSTTTSEAQCCAMNACSYDKIEIAKDLMQMAMQIQGTVNKEKCLAANQGSGILLPIGIPLDLPVPEIIQPGR